MASSSWDSHPWERADYGPVDDDDEVDMNPEKNPVAAGAKLADMLLEMYLASKISAQALCELCWYASKAGVRGSVELYASKPGQSFRKLSALPRRSSWLWGGHEGLLRHESARFSEGQDDWQGPA
eukprot:6515720-Alexandrium_andersonii.AAC.1